MVPDLLDSPIVGLDPDAVAAAVAAVRSYCRWHIAISREETVTLDGSGARRLLLPSLYVTEVSEVVENGTALSVDDYSVRSNGILRRTGNWWTCEDIEVTFTHGYASCPADVLDVVTRLAKNGATARSGGATVRVGQVSFTPSQSQAAGAAGLDSYSKTVLDAYRRVP